MKNVISLRDLEEMIRQGRDLRTLPPDAILTPSARDLLRELESNGALKPKPSTPPTAPQAVPGQPSQPQPPAQLLSSKSPRAELEAFFHSAWCQELKEQMCDIGRRLWQRAYVDGNGGNLAIRVGQDLALCTPTLISKGFMKPEDMCLVDFEGNQIFGNKKRTSEILMHLQMMKAQPKDVASVHCHPPYATAFAVVGIAPPTCVIPEYEVFVSVAVAPYQTPGTPQMAKLVADLVDKYNTILMGNHGVVTWSHNNLEEAYWRAEIIEAYCRTLMVAAQLGRPINTLTPQQLKELLKIKETLGFVDPRYGLQECELCHNDDWRPGVTCQVPPKPDAVVGYDPEAEALVQAITDEIMEQLK